MRHEIPRRRLRRIAAALAAVTCTLLASAAIIPAAWAAVTYIPNDSPDQAPASAVVPAGGVPGWQITLIALGAALVAATAAVLLDGPAPSAGPPPQPPREAPARPRRQRPSRHLHQRDIMYPAVPDNQFGLGTRQTGIASANAPIGGSACIARLIRQRRSVVSGRRHCALIGGGQASAAKAAR